MTDDASTTVGVIGLNPRGSALARALLDHDHKVVVWDEEPHPGDTALGSGAVHADNLRWLLAATPLLVLCVEDYIAARRILEQVADDLPGHDVINLTSGDSAQADELSDWVTDSGGRYLDGALMAHPEHVGNADTVLVFSGSEAVFGSTEALLGQFGTAYYLGPAAGTASLYDAALLNFAWATLTGFLYSAALLQTAEVRASSVAPMLTHWLKTTVTDVIGDYAHQVDHGQYPGAEEWLELDHPLMGHLVRAHEMRGLDAALPQLVAGLTSRGIDAGHGSDSFASLIEIIKQGPEVS
jgi:3-hydroxyisobutyrate dehydrogenase-like beta-hydroxyacid dehydrogenase